MKPALSRTATALEPLEQRRLLASIANADVPPTDQPGAGEWESAAIFGVHRIYGGAIEGEISTEDDVDMFRFQGFAGSLGDAFGAKIVPDAGLTLYVKVYSSPGVLLYDYGPATSERPLAVPFTLNENHYVEVRSDGDSIGSYRVNMYAGLGVYDSNQSYQMPIDGGTFSGATVQSRGLLQYQGDKNVHRFNVTPDTRATVRVARDDGATADPKIRVFTVGGDGTVTVLGENDNAQAGQTAAEVTFDSGSATAVYVEVVDAAGTGIGDYTVEIKPPANRPPLLAFSANQGKLKQGQPLILTATDVTDPDGDDIRQVSIFRDTNNNGLYDAEDERLVSDTNGADGWSVSVNTAGYAVGQHRFFAFAYDGTSWSKRTDATVTIEAADINPGNDLALQFTTPASDVSVDRGDIVDITWSDGDVEGATLKLYLTLEDPPPLSLASPTILLATLDGSSANNSFAWDTSTIAPGTYTIMGFLYTHLSTSPVDPSAFARANAGGRVTVEHDGSYVRGDFDGDGRADLVCRDPATGDVRLRLMNGAQQKAVVALPRLGDAQWELAATGDFDGDGDEDILFQHAVSNRNSIWLMNGTQLAGFKGIAYSPHTDWKVQTAGDFDGDQKADLVWHNSATGHNTFWLMNGMAIKGFKGFGQTRDLSWRIGAAADFDQDGQLDLAWKKDDGDTATLWLMNGTTLKSYSPAPPTLHSNERIVGAADYDGDGDADLLLAAGTSLRVWWMDKTTITDAARYSLSGLGAETDVIG
jgi:hypothetical protein